MSKDKTGGSAFPTVGSQYSHEEGMTLRDYFAAKAMQGIISGSHENGEVHYMEEITAESAYKMADAMLVEREKQQ